MKKILTLSAFFSFLLVPLAAEAQTAVDEAPKADAGPTVEEGRKIWMTKKNKCIKCHGEDGKAQTKMGKKKSVADMTTAEWQKRFSDEQIMNAVLKGIKRKDGERNVKMKPLKGATERDAKAVLMLVRSFAPKK